MTRTRISAVALFLALASGPVHAQNREHQQMAADLQILEQKVSQLQLANNQLAEQVKALTTRLDEAAEANVRAFANQQAAVKELLTTINTVRARLDDNTVTVKQLTQEQAGLRQGMVQLSDSLNTIISLLQPADAAPSGSSGAAGSGASASRQSPTTPPAAAASRPGAGTLGPVNLPASPTRIYDDAYGDYMSGRYDLAIEGFQDFLETYPDAVNAPNALFFIGQAHYQRGRYNDALAAYGKVVAGFPDHDKAPDSLLGQGLCHEQLNQREQARRTFQLVAARYPDSTSAIQATNRLNSMGAN